MIGINKLKAIHTCAGEIQFITLAKLIAQLKINYNTYDQSPTIRVAHPAKLTGQCFFDGIEVTTTHMPATEYELRNFKDRQLRSFMSKEFKDECIQTPIETENFMETIEEESVKLLYDFRHPDFAVKLDKETIALVVSKELLAHVSANLTTQETRGRLIAMKGKFPVIRCKNLDLEPKMRPRVLSENEWKKKARSKKRSNNRRATSKS